MENEQLAIFDDSGKRCGVATRSEVHAKGFWHETFHCWIAHHDGDQGDVYLYFQLRSNHKKDYGGLLDITAAGHILSHETIEDGIREIHEELGVMIKMNELEPLGILKGELIQGDFIDRELTHVFLYSKPVACDVFRLQPEEVAGIYRSTLQDFKALVQCEKTEIEVEGFIVEEGEQKYSSKSVSYLDFVPHKRSYLSEIIDSISSCLKEVQGTIHSTHGQRRS
ncbi:NUDIX hydrolase (plasmid) [Cytobacillus spongiae]|uniref:NUDIX hydrolase n=1 Tax=Cytobacillus spongiae TaxID=2901381 RepID=UPI001F35F180|nr:NUDIX domain-containing protein [Cytobacillus spongiae]UII58176.1 NUDIX hydrolase [Cytobacillus spongiae]